VEGWIQWVFGPGFRLYSRFFVVSRSFLVACLVCRLGFAFGDDGKGEEEDGGRGERACFALGGWGGVVVGKRLPPLQSHAIEWARDWVRVIAALHHAIDKVEKPSLDGI
jgi:hypothetical protein